MKLRKTLASCLNRFSDKLKNFVAELIKHMKIFSGNTGN